MQIAYGKVIASNSKIQQHRIFRFFRNLLLPYKINIMSFKYLIDSDNKIVYLRIVGPLTKDLEVQVFKDLISAPNWKKNFNILEDITQVDKVTLSYGDIVAIVDEQANLQEKGLFNAKLAIVDPLDSLHFIGRIWQQLGKSRKIDIGFYRKKKEAINWLNGDLT